LCREVNDSALDAMLAEEDRLTVQLEEGLIPLLYVVVISKGDSRHGDDSSLDSLKVLADSDPKLFEGTKLIVISELFYQVQDFPLLLVWRLDRFLRYLLSSEIIKVIRNSRHETKLRDEQNLEILVLTPVFNFQERLFIVGYFDLVLLLIVLLDRDAGVVKLDRVDVFKHDVLDTVIGSFSVVCHDNLSD